MPKLMNKELTGAEILDATRLLLWSKGDECPAYERALTELVAVLFIEDQDDLDDPLVEPMANYLAWHGEFSLVPSTADMQWLGAQ